MKSISLLVASLSSLALVAAHFTLDYPTSRGFDEEIEPNFCGGFPNVLSPRQIFPLGSAPIVISSYHLSAQVAISISLANNPTTFNNFSTTSTGESLPMVKGFGTITGQGTFCLNIDIGALNIPNVSNGTNATLQIVFNGGDGALYQCTDIVLSSTFTASNVTCFNSTSSATSTSSSVSTATAAATTATAAATSAAAAATTTTAAVKPAAALRMEVGGGAALLAAAGAAIALDWI